MGEYRRKQSQFKEVKEDENLEKEAQLVKYILTKKKLLSTLRFSIF
jgi:hypothetical protein